MRRFYLILIIMLPLFSCKKESRVSTPEVDLTGVVFKAEDERKAEFRVIDRSKCELWMSEDLSDDLVKEVLFTYTINGPYITFYSVDIGYELLGYLKEEGMMLINLWVTDNVDDYKPILYSASKNIEAISQRYDNRVIDTEWRFNFLDIEFDDNDDNIIFKFTSSSQVDMTLTEYWMGNENIQKYTTIYHFYDDLIRVDLTFLLGAIVDLIFDENDNLIPAVRLGTLKKH